MAEPPAGRRCGILDNLTKVPQVFRNPGGSPALQGARFSSGVKIDPVPSSET
jgi:hypothetical protein